MLVLSEAEVRKQLPMRAVIEALRSAFAAQARGELNQPLRTLARIPAGILGSMPAALGGEALGAKLVTFFPGNGARGMHTHQALIALFDPADGSPLCIMDGRYITEVRTAAASALATEVLAPPNARVAAILGTGVQAGAHAEALAEVLALAELRIWGRTPAHAQALADRLRAAGMNTCASASVREACAGAQVVCTVTSTRDPILTAADVDPGTHINAVGFAGPEARELAGDLVSRATLVVDSPDSALHEAGDIRFAIRDGALGAAPKLTPLCDVLAGKAPGRTSATEITVFESVGIALEDVACADHVFRRASAAGAGTDVQL